MFNLLGASLIMGTILDFLGVAGIIFFGSFIVILMIDLILSAISDKEGLFFNKAKNEDNAEGETVMYNVKPQVDTVVETPAADENGVVYFENQPEKVTPIDFDKAAEEQEALASKLEEPQEDFYAASSFDDEDEEDIEAIALEVANQAVKELEGESVVAEKKVYKVKEVEPVFEEPVLEEVEEEVIVDDNSEELRRLEEERAALEKQVAELNEQREKDKEEYLKTIQTLQDKEPVIIDKNKEEEEKRRLANITKMNSRLSRIKSNTKKIENKAKEEKVVAPAPAPVVVEEQPEVVVVAPAPAPVVVEEQPKAEKPRFKKEYYENRLEVLEQELREVQAEFKQNKKDFVPLQKVYKTFEKDEAKLRRQEAIVAKQQISLHGVNKNKITDEKKAKLEENTKKLKELKESVYSCKQVIEQNKDRYPILEKNNKLLEKQINRLTEDITSVKEALKWYEENNG